MPKPKAPRWLTEGFRDGVDEQMCGSDYILRRLRPGEMVACWLAQHDPARRPCEGKIERFHFIPRQRVENAMYAMLHDAIFEATQFSGSLNDEIWDLILLAAWDPRNGGLGCEGHHRRFDDHAVSLPRDRIIVPYSALPAHVVYFAFDWGLEAQLDKFPSSI